jgi:phage baseplate assembly protein W
MGDISHNFGSDLDLNAAGDFLYVDGYAETTQHVVKRLLTAPGAYIWNLLYGAGLGQFVGQPMNAKAIENVVNSQIFQEQDVAQLPLPVVTTVANADGTVTVTIVYADAATGQQNTVSFPLAPISTAPAESATPAAAAPVGTLAISALPATVYQGVATSFSGNVTPSGNAVDVGLSASSTTPPTAWAAASVQGGAWTVIITPPNSGTYYVWARIAGAPTVVAVSPALNVGLTGLTLLVPSTGLAGAALAISGGVVPATDAVSIVLATQNLTAPTTGWTPAAVSGGTFTASITPTQAGTYYAWAQDTVTGLYAVSGAITVTAAAGVTYGINNPGGTYTAGSGIIGLNGSVTPAQVIGTQVALSTSNSVVPTSWQPARVIYGNAGWAIYYPTPSAPGDYYVWVQTTSGTDTIVSTFTVTVS